MVANNQEKILSEVVSIDAWFNKASEERCYSFHTDVVFKIGRLGGEEEAQVTFELAIRRAELIIKMSPTEPATIRPESISRDEISHEGEITLVTKSNKSLGASMGLSITNLLGSSGLAEAKAAFSKAEEIRTKRQFRCVMAEQSLDADRNYMWSFSVPGNDALKGRPWDAATLPRLQILDTRPDPCRGIAPGLSVLMRCKQEDMRIGNIKSKVKQSVYDHLTLKARKNKEIAAEAHIRKYFSAGFDAKTPYSDIKLADLYFSLEASGK